MVERVDDAASPDRDGAAGGPGGPQRGGVRAVRLVDVDATGRGHVDAAPGDRGRVRPGLEPVGEAVDRPDEVPGGIDANQLAAQGDDHVAVGGDGGEELGTVRAVPGLPAPLHGAAAGVKPDDAAAVDFDEHDE